MDTAQGKHLKRNLRRRRVRARVQGTAERPRLAIYRSLRHISAQIINDVEGKTIAAASDAQLKGKRATANVEVAHAVGKLIAERAAAAKVKRVVFDRGGRMYHGQVKALAEGAREGGLEF